ALGGTRLDATFERDLHGACVRLADEAEASVRAGRTALVLSDHGGGTPIPMLLAVGAVHHRLVRRGLRTLATLVAADKVGGDRPPPDEAQRRFRAAIEDGVLKIMSKMGIADVAAYCGAQVFDVVGLAPEVVELCFPGTPSAVGGIGFDELEREALVRGASTRLESPGYVKFRKGGEPHETDADVVEAAHALRLAVRNERRDRYERFAELVDGRPPMELRDLVELVPAAEPV